MDKYDGKLHIEIWDDKGFLACIIKQKIGYFEPYHGEIYKDVLDWVTKALLNYNKNLISVKDNIPREIFALRFVEQLCVQGDSRFLTPSKSPMTKKALKPYREHYYLKNKENPWAWVSFDKEETERIMGGKIPLRVYVNISTKTVLLNNFITELDEYTYSCIFNVDKEEIGHIRMGLVPCPIILTQFDFNMMDEVREILETNKNGFMSASFFKNFEVLK